MSQAERERYYKKFGVQSEDPERVKLSEYNKMIVKAYMWSAAGKIDNKGRRTPLDTHVCIEILQKIYQLPGGIALENAMNSLSYLHTHKNIEALCRTVKLDF